VAFDDIRGHQARLLADPDSDASFDQLIDTTPVTNFDISTDEAKNPGAASRRLLPGASSFLPDVPNITV